MLRKEYVDRVNLRFKKRMLLSSKKSADYATENVLSNFDRVGAVVEILRIKSLPGPLCYCFIMLIQKMDRWINLLLSGNSPNCEGIEDTVIDLSNYLDLTEATSFDLSKEKK